MPVDEIKRIQVIQNISSLNEFTTRTAIKFPLLRELNCKTQDPGEMIQEFQAGLHSNK